MTNLLKLAKKYRTEKLVHNYFSVYNYFLKQVEVKRMLEIGIEKGCSLQMWQEYWPEAEIWGIDNDPKKLINTGHIHSILADQSKPDSLQLVAAILKPLDFICDDGSHVVEDQILTLRTFLPLLAPGGFYVIEDVADRFTTLSYVIEVINCQEHWNYTQNDIGEYIFNHYYLNQLETGRFYDSRLIVMRKLPPLRTKELKQIKLVTSDCYFNAKDRLNKF